MIHKNKKVKNILKLKLLREAKLLKVTCISFFHVKMFGWKKLVLDVKWDEIEIYIHYLQQVTYTFLTLFGEEMKNITYDGFISKFVTTRFLFYFKNYFFSFTETAFGSNFTFMYKRGIFPSKTFLHIFFSIWKLKRKYLWNMLLWYAEP